MSETISIASRIFKNVPTILQVENTPILQAVTSMPGGFRATFPVYHSDGNKIAVVKGTQVYPTSEGERAKLKLIHEPNLTVCELEKQVILELRRNGAAGIKGWAELYGPEGVLVSAADYGMSVRFCAGDYFVVDAAALKSCSATAPEIGVQFTRQGIKVGTEWLQSLTTVA